MSALLIAAECLFPINRAVDIASIGLRQTRSDNVGALQGFVRALSPASRRLRFHASLNELSEAMLKAVDLCPTGAFFVIRAHSRREGSFEDGYRPVAAVSSTEADVRRLRLTVNGDWATGGITVRAVTAQWA